MRQGITFLVGIGFLANTSCRETTGGELLRIEDEIGREGQCSARVRDGLACDAEHGGQCANGDQRCRCAAASGGKVGIIRCEATEEQCPEEASVCLPGDARECVNGSDQRECSCLETSADAGPDASRGYAWQCFPVCGDGRVYDPIAEACFDDVTCTCPNAADQCREYTCIAATRCDPDHPCPEDYGCDDHGQCVCENFYACGVACESDDGCGSEHDCNLRSQTCCPTGWKYNESYSDECYEDTGCTCASAEDQCFEYLCVGQACDSDAPCPTGYSCGDIGSGDLGPGRCFCEDSEVCGAACDSDADCGDYLACDGAPHNHCREPRTCGGDDWCFEGLGGCTYDGETPRRCAVPGEKAAGESCDVGADCESGVCYFGNVCVDTCETNGDCNPGFTCMDFLEFNACLVDAESACPDCADQSDRVCNEFSCVLPGCRVNSDCGTGEHCERWSGGDGHCYSGAGATTCGDNTFTNSHWSLVERCGVPIGCWRESDCEEGMTCDAWDGNGKICQHPAPAPLEPADAGPGDA